MSLEQVAALICKREGVDYRALSDSKKQPYLMKAASQQRETNA